MIAAIITPMPIVSAGTSNASRSGRRASYLFIVNVCKLRQHVLKLPRFLADVNKVHDQPREKSSRFQRLRQAPAFP